MSGELKPCPFCGEKPSAFPTEQVSAGYLVKHPAVPHCPVTPGLYTVEQWNTRHDAALIEALEGALQTIADGDVPRPIGEKWRSDGLPSKHDRCIHNEWLYDDCASCTADFARTSLTDPKGRGD